MWEWKLSIEESNRFFQKEDKENFIHLSYQNFIQSPSENIKNIFDFLKLNYTENWIKEIIKNIKRKSPEIKTTENKNLYLIGQDILNQTIDNSYAPY